MHSHAAVMEKNICRQNQDGLILPKHTLNARVFTQCGNPLWCDNDLQMKVFIVLMNVLYSCTYSLPHIRGLTKYLNDISCASQILFKEFVDLLYLIFTFFGAHHNWSFNA